jgi:hypothetical protein
VRLDKRGDDDVLTDYGDIEVTYRHSLTLLGLAAGEVNNPVQTQEHVQ